MGFFDSARDALDKGVEAAGNAASGAKAALLERAVENQPFMQGLARLCTEGWLQGWHECNGGNLSYRLTAEEVTAIEPSIVEAPANWVQMQVCAPELAGAYLAVTGTGTHLRTIANDLATGVGIVELDDAGGAYRVVWGLRTGGRPTSEFEGHVLMHAARMSATAGEARVVYHAHPHAIVALTKLLPLDDRTFSRTLWEALTECLLAFPQGVGVVGALPPGSIELARASAQLMERRSAVVWAHHGLLCTGASLDAAFGLMHTIEKAAHIYLMARAANAGKAAFANALGADELRTLAQGMGVTLDEELLGD